MNAASTSHRMASSRRNEQPVNDETGAPHREKGIAHLNAGFESRLLEKNVDRPPELLTDRSDKSNSPAVPEHASPPRHNNCNNFAEA